MTEIQTDWAQVAKLYGPLGVFCLIAIGLIKVLLNHIKRQHEEHVEALKSTIGDARTERDYMRKRYDEKTEQFLDALRVRDDKMKAGFDEVVEALRRRTR